MIYFRMCSARRVEDYAVRVAQHASAAASEQIETVVSSSETTNAAAEQLALRCPTWHSFAEAYVDDLARGALCIPTEHTPPLLSVVIVQLYLPDSLNITLRTRVVQVLTSADAETGTTSTMLALELLDLHGEHRQQLAQLVAFVRSQRDGEAEHGSFTRTLLDQTPSIPPSELGRRLSQLPVAHGSAERHSQIAIANDNNDSSDSGYRHTAARRSRADEITRPLSPARERAQRASHAPGEGDTAAQAQSTDPLKLKALLSSIAHKHYDEALRIAAELLEANPADAQVHRWRALCRARIALTRNDPGLAAAAYAKVLDMDPGDREAREYIREHERAKKLEALPFGRYFAKRK